MWRTDYGSGGRDGLTGRVWLVGLVWLDRYRQTGRWLPARLARRQMCRRCRLWRHGAFGLQDDAVGVTSVLTLGSSTVRLSDDGTLWALRMAHALLMIEVSQPGNSQDEKEWGTLKERTRVERGAR